MRVGKAEIISQQNCAKRHFLLLLLVDADWKSRLSIIEGNDTSCIVGVKRLTQMLNDLHPWTKTTAHRVCALWHKYCYLIKTQVRSINRFFEVY